MVWVDSNAIKLRLQGLHHARHCLCTKQSPCRYLRINRQGDCFVLRNDETHLNLIALGLIVRVHSNATPLITRLLVFVAMMICSPNTSTSTPKIPTRPNYRPSTIDPKILSKSISTSIPKSLCIQTIDHQPSTIDH